MTKVIDYLLAATVLFAYWLFVINPVYVWCLNRYYPVPMSEYVWEEEEKQSAHNSEWRPTTVDEWLAEDTRHDLEFTLLR